MVDSCTAGSSGSSSTCRCSGGSPRPASGAEPPCNSHRPFMIIHTNSFTQFILCNRTCQNIGTCFISRFVVKVSVILVWFLPVSLASTSIVSHGGWFTCHTHFEPFCYISHPVCVWPVLHCAVGRPRLQCELHTEPGGSRSRTTKVRAVSPPILTL